MTQGNEDKLKEMNDMLKVSFKKIRSEMDEHLESINENTKEFDVVYKYMYELEEKIEKLNERIDDVYMLIGKREKYQNFQLKEKLTIREQEVFLILYTNVDNEGPLSYRDIAKSLNLTDNLVRECISGLVEKGVPLVKKYIHNKTYLELDENFRLMQAKHNLLDINENLTKEIVK